MKNYTYELVLPGNKNKMYLLEKFVEDISDEYNLGHTYFSNILATLHELVTNAIVHGNKNDTSKKVKILCNNNEGKLIFSISDQGLGFDCENITNTLDIDNFSEGNGLYIAKTLSDELSFENNGSKVIVTFNIADANKELISKRANVLKSSETQKTDTKIHDENKQ